VLDHGRLRRHADDGGADIDAVTVLAVAADDHLAALFDGLGHGGRDFSAMLQMLRGRLDALEVQ
jgi:3-hydroxyisobutyrate dehydrogenase